MSREAINQALAGVSAAAHREQRNTMSLTIELTDAEYEAVLDSLTEAINALGGFRTHGNIRSVHAIELQHLRTLISEATTRTAINSMIRGN